MALEQDIAALVAASDNLTQAVEQKIAHIDQKVDQSESDFRQWRTSVQAKDINGEALYKSVIDLTGLSTDHFYPVWWSMPSNREGETQLTICRNYADDAGLAPFGAGVVHIAGLNLQLEGTATPWSGDANYLTTKRLSQTYRKTARAIQFGMKCIARPNAGTKPLYAGFTDGQVVSSSTRSGLYLRGGLTYQVRKSFPGEVLYSRDIAEVSIGAAQTDNWEINWKVKPYHIDDTTLGTDYPESRLAYSLDFDKRYAPKV